METLWQAVYLTIAIMVLVALPFILYWYDCDEEWTCVILYINAYL